MIDLSKEIYTAAQVYKMLAHYKYYLLVKCVINDQFDTGPEVEFNLDDHSEFLEKLMINKH